MLPAFPLPAHVKGGAPKTCCDAFNYAYQECGQCERALPKYAKGKSEREGSGPIRSRILAWHARPPLTDINFVRLVMCCPRCTLNSLQFRSLWFATGRDRGSKSDRRSFVLFPGGQQRGLGADVAAATATSIDERALITASRGTHTCSPVPDADAVIRKPLNPC